MIYIETSNSEEKSILKCETVEEEQPINLLLIIVIIYISNGILWR